MADTYLDLTTLKSSGVLNITGAGLDSRLLPLLENVSRWIDDHCGRWFYSLTATRRFDGDGGPSLPVSDLIAVTTLRTDEDQDGALERTWRDDEYLLYPLDAQPQQPWGRPYSRVQANPGPGVPSGFPRGRATVEISGRWGFREVFQSSGASIAPGAGLASADASLTVTDGEKLAAGQTILVGSEQLYVGAIAGDVLTVRRGVNGTTAEGHAAGVSISYAQCPGAVVEACLLQTALLWQRRDAFLAGPTGVADGFGVDSQVQRLLAPYRRLPVGV